VGAFFGAAGVADGAAAADEAGEWEGDECE
jgi:hypothetical protein